MLWCEGRLEWYNISNLDEISSLNFFPSRYALSLGPLSSCHSQVIKESTTFTVPLSPELGNTIRRSLFTQAHVDFVEDCLTFGCFSPAVQRWWVCVSWDACRPNLHTLCLDDVVSAQAPQITVLFFSFYHLKLLSLLRSHHPHRCCQIGSENISQQISELVRSQQRPRTWFGYAFVSTFSKHRSFAVYGKQKNK